MKRVCCYYVKLPYLNSEFLVLQFGFVFQELIRTTEHYGKF